jgi:hypothetical protein
MVTTISVMERVRGVATAGIVGTTLVYAVRKDGCR